MGYKVKLPPSRPRVDSNVSIDSLMGEKPVTPVTRPSVGMRVATPGEGIPDGINPPVLSPAGSKVAERTSSDVPMGSPAPPTCPPLPSGLRLIRYQPKSPPVAVQPCIVVTDVEAFINHYLAELDARLHHPLQIRGGGGVWEILLKLQEAGVELALEPVNRVPPGTDPGTHGERSG